jgi:hypothetical protein
MLDQSIVRGEGVSFARSTRFIRRPEAAEYLETNYRFGAFKSLSQGAMTVDTPAFRKTHSMRISVATEPANWSKATLPDSGPV